MKATTKQLLIFLGVIVMLSFIVAPTWQRALLLAAITVVFVFIERRLRQKFLEQGGDNVRRIR